MKIYSNTLSLPELASLPDEERIRICKEADQSVLRNDGKKRALGFGVWVALVMVGVSVGKDHGFWGGLTGTVVGSVLGAFVLHQLLVRAALPYIRESLRKKKPA